MYSFFPKRSYAYTLIAAGLALGLSGCCGHHNDYSGKSGSVNVGTLGINETAKIILGYYPGEESIDYSEKAMLTGGGGKEIVLRPSANTSVDKELTDRSCDRQNLEPMEREALKKFQRNRVAQKGETLAKTEINDTYTKLKAGETTTVYCANSGKSGVVVEKMHENNETNSVIVLAERDSEGHTVIDKDQALELDKYFGTKNDYDPDGSPIGKVVRGIFGTEWLEGGGIDGTEKLVVIFFSNSTIKGLNGAVYGYMTYIDCLPKTEDKNSNMGEIIYLNASKTDVDRYSTLAHEFQHLCNFNQKYVHNGDYGDPDNIEVTNITEGQSVLAEDETGFSLTMEKEVAGEKVEWPGNYFIGKTLTEYLTNSLIYNSFTWGNGRGDYGKSYMVMRFIADQFGLDCVTDIATSPASGQANIEYFTEIPFGTLLSDMSNASLGVEGMPSDYQFKNLVLGKEYWLQENSTTEPGYYDIPVMTGYDTTVSDFKSVEADLRPNTSALINVAGEGGTFKFSYSLPEDYTLSYVVVSNNGKYGKYERMEVVK